MDIGVDEGAVCWGRCEVESASLEVPDTGSNIQFWSYGMIFFGAKLLPPACPMQAVFYPTILKHGNEELWKDFLRIRQIPLELLNHCWILIWRNTVLTAPINSPLVY